MTGPGADSPLLATKLFVPVPRAGSVPRPRLDALLDRARDVRLVLVSAPPGFGKTTAVAHWLVERERADRAGGVAWLSLDPGERSAPSFWTAVLTTLAAAVPGVGSGVLPLLRSPTPPVEVVLTTVLNELAASERDVVLVLDDYHLADGPGTGPGMAFLLDHLPPRVHVVICTRADPDLSLARLRARGELVEVRAADLRFTADEVAEYLDGDGGLALEPEQVAALGARTEGWIAALQLAVLSLRGREDTAGFVDGFAGDRYVVDYLVEEVLARQTAEVRDFLLRTSVLARLTGPLCDAVTGRPGGRLALESLERANLFVVALDRTRRWYRYHQLFADVLLARLTDDDPGLVPELHRRASRWHAEAGEPSPAVRHALAAGDVDRAAELVEAAVPALQRQRREATIRGWLDDLPDEVVRRRPVLAVGFIGALMSGNEFAAVPARLDAVEALLSTCPPGAVVGPWRPPGTVVVDDAQLARLPGAVELYRAGLALVDGDLPRTHRHALLATDRAAPDDDLTRAGAAALSALASWSAGDLATAQHGYLGCIEGLRRTGNVSDVLGCTLATADLLVARGRLGEAVEACEGGLRLAAPDGGAVRGTADLHVAIGGVALARGELPSAAEHLRRAESLGDGSGLPQNPYRRRLLQAWIRRLDGDLPAALALVDEAQRVHVADFSPPVRPVPAVRARLLLVAGDVAGASGWAARHAVTAEDDLSYLREFEHLTVARILLAQVSQPRSRTARGPEAGLLGRLLGRLLAAADAGGRVSSVVEILALRALALRAGGDAAAALVVLEQGLEIAEPEGHVTVFAAEGPPMAALLGAAAERRPRSDYLSRLVAACAPRRPMPGAGRPGGRPAGPANLLSGRELAVLRLLATDLSGPEIARELVVSLNTVRSHTKSIYTKLDVGSRRAAVRRADALGLLAPVADG